MAVCVIGKLILCEINNECMISSDKLHVYLAVMPRFLNVKWILLCDDSHFRCFARAVSSYMVQWYQ